MDPIASGPDPAGPRNGGSAAGMPISSAARAVGVSVETLRKWDSRYGLGPSRVSSGGHRRYTQADVERLAAMRALVARGTATAEAARVVVAPASLHLPPDLSPAGARLAAAATALDGPVVRQIVADALDSAGTIPTWEHDLRPVLRAVGAAAAVSRHSVAVEHVLSEMITSALTGGADPAVAGSRPAPVLLACAPGEEHVLPLVVLRRVLAERGIAAALLDGGTSAEPPTTALGAAVRSLAGVDGPVVVLLALTGLARTSEESFAFLRACGRLVLAGPGWPATSAGPRTEDLTDTLDVLHEML
jgi:MerR family transcriptional regulator, light-induced transcriptional regulator